MLSIGEGVFIGISMFIVGIFFGYSMGSLNKFANYTTNESEAKK